MTRKVNMDDDNLVPVDQFSSMLLESILRQMRENFTFLRRNAEFGDEHTALLSSLAQKTGMNVALVADLFHRAVLEGDEENAVPTETGMGQHREALMSGAILRFLQRTFGGEYHFVVIDGQVVTYIRQELSWRMP